MSTTRNLLSAAAATLALAGAIAPAASAEFGLADSAGAALPDPKAFWAGACDLDGAPPIGDPIPGGVGSRPATILVPNNGGIFANPSGPFLATPIPAPAPAGPPACIDHGTLVHGVPAWAPPPSWRLAPSAAAGAHPDGSATFTMERPHPPLAPGTNPNEVEGTVDNISVDLPPGFVGNPTVLPKCTGAQFAAKPVRCPPESQAGIAEIATRAASTGGVEDRIYPIYNLEPRQGRVAEFGIPDVAQFTPVRIVAKARTNGDFGVTTFVPQIPAAVELYGQTITLWGVPWAAEHDPWRAKEFIYGPEIPEPQQKTIPHSGLPPAERAVYSPSWGPIRPFISNPTECDGRAPVTRAALDEYRAPGAFTPEGDPDLSDPDWKVYDSRAAVVTDCAKPPFQPDIALSPTSNQPDSPTGLDVGLTIPQNDDPPHNVRFDPDDTAGAPAHWDSDAGRATAQLDKAVVTLPSGVAVNPAGASGLAGCSDAQIGLRQLGNPPLFNNDDPFDGQGAECPAGSKIGVVEVQTPLLAERLTGEVVLGEPRSTDPQSGEMFRLFIVVRNRERGLVAKIFGRTVADPSNGQLTATFDKNPRVPFEHMSLSFKGGERATLAMPQRCGSPGWSSSFTPWTAAHGGGAIEVLDGGAFDVVGDCSLGFAPKLDAGMSTPTGGANGSFSFTLTRQDREQWLRGVAAELPTGLLASVKDVPLCTGAQASAGACPAASRIGTVDGGAGSGAPFFLERKGDAYLTEGYKGAPYGLVVRVPVEAGPFRGQFALTPIVIRQALYVDPDDGSVTAVSDPLPQIWHGIPLRVRQVTVRVDRPRFMVNPTSCAAKRIVATVESVEGATASPAQPFQASGCASLPFKPKLTMRLIGRRQVTSGRHPTLTSTLRARRGDANVSRAEVRLPLSLALDPNNTTDPKLLCSYEGGLAGNCPASSIIGRASAVSPLLKRRLSGPVHMVQGIRFSARGNRIRTTPTLLVKLRGEVVVNLRATTTARGGKLISTFHDVPDAAVSRFDIRINGGRKGILVVTRTRRGPLTICGRQVAEADLDAQSGRQRDVDVRIKTPCKAKKKKRKAGRGSRGRGR